MSGGHQTRWTLAIDGDTLTASTSAATYTIALGVSYQPRACASSKGPRLATAFLDGGMRIYSRNAVGGRTDGGGNRTLSTIDSFVHTYMVPRRARYEAAHAVAAPSMELDTQLAALAARVGAVETIVRRIAAELGVAVDQAVKP